MSRPLATPLRALAILGFAFVMLDVATAPPPELDAAFWLMLGVWLLGHVVRAIRLVVLLGERGRSVRAVVAAHVATIALAADVPYKLGEIGRIIALGLAGRPWDGVRAVWIERTFDAAALGLAAVVVTAMGDTRPWPILVAAGVWLVGTAAALTVVPEGAAMAKATLLRRYDTSWSVRALAALTALRAELTTWRQMLNGKVATLSLMTVAVWACELGFAAIATRGLDASPLAGLLGSLAIVLDPSAEGADVARIVVLLGAAITAPLGMLLAGLAHDRAPSTEAHP